MKNDAAAAKKCKKLCAISLFLSVLLLLFPASVFAHAGRTDANGGHFNSKTGDYHYHHGWPAHYHTNGECPYDFIDVADHSTGLEDELSALSSSLRESSTKAYDNGYDTGYRDGKTDGYGIGYDDGLEEGQETGYQTGLEDGRKEQFQYYPIVIASICVISGIIILALTANRHKLKEDLTDQISSGKRKLRDLEEELQLEMDKSKRDFDAMKNSYQNELDRAAQRFNQLQTAHQSELERSDQKYNQLQAAHQNSLKTTSQKYSQLQSSYQTELEKARQIINSLEEKYKQALIQFGEAKREASQAITSSRLAKYSADQRVKSCEQFIAMFGGSAEEFFARQDAPERLAKMQADYLTLVYEASAIYLENKQRPAYKEAQRIRELKADTARYIERMKKAEYECDQLREQLRITKKVYSVSDHTET